MISPILSLWAITNQVPPKLDPRTQISTRVSEADRAMFAEVSYRYAKLILGVEVQRRDWIMEWMPRRTVMISRSNLASLFLAPSGQLRSLRSRAFDNRGRALPAKSKVWTERQGITRAEALLRKCWPNCTIGGGKVKVFPVEQIRPSLWNPLSNTMRVSVSFRWQGSERRYATVLFALESGACLAFTVT